jgi:acylphosphatase
MAANQHTRLTARVTGLVQGVNFRWFVQRRANELNVVGYVKNEPDGSVSFVAEGPREALERLLDFARSGPSSAVVENVETHWGAPTGEFYRFEIRY